MTGQQRATESTVSSELLNDQGCCEFQMSNNSFFLALLRCGYWCCVVITCVVWHPGCRSLSRTWTASCRLRAPGPGQPIGSPLWNALRANSTEYSNPRSAGRAFLPLLVTAHHCLHIGPLFFVSHGPGHAVSRQTRSRCVTWAGFSFLLLLLPSSCASSSGQGGPGHAVSRQTRLRRVTRAAFSFLLLPSYPHVLLFRSRQTRSRCVT